MALLFAFPTTKRQGGCRLPILTASALFLIAVLSSTLVAEAAANVTKHQKAFVDNYDYTNLPLELDLSKDPVSHSKRQFLKKVLLFIAAVSFFAGFLSGGGVCVAGEKKYKRGAEKLAKEKAEAAQEQPQQQGDGGGHQTGDAAEVEKMPSAQKAGDDPLANSGWNTEMKQGAAYIWGGRVTTNISLLFFCLVLMKIFDYRYRAKNRTWTMSKLLALNDHHKLNFAELQKNLEEQLWEIQSLQKAGQQALQQQQQPPPPPQNSSDLQNNEPGTQEVPPSSLPEAAVALAEQMARAANDDGTNSDNI